VAAPSAAERCAAAFAVVPGLALACSGPGAPEAIGRAELTGLLGLVAALVLVVIGSVRRRRKGRRWRGIAVGSLVLWLNPFLWLSARSGDCGSTLVVATVAVTLIALAWAVWPVKAPARQVG
jgi:hypothetical protein